MRSVSLFRRHYVSTVSVNNLKSFQLAAPPPERERLKTESRVGVESEVNSGDITDLWPIDLIQKKFNRDIEITPIKRPHLWVNSWSKSSSSQVGRFARFTRDDLMELLPEGLAGELSRDIILTPNRKRDVGIMIRKLGVELTWQLSQLQDKKEIKKSGWLIDGKRGVGKSSVLVYVTLWARENGWLVVSEPNVGAYAKEIAEIKRSNSGLYIQNEFAQKFLERLIIRNKDMLEQIPVDKSRYGLTGLDGSTNLARRLYDPLVDKAISKLYPDADPLSEEVLRRTIELRKQVKIPSMKAHCKDPSTVLDIVDFGLEQEPFATQAVHEVMIQLKQQTKFPLLVVCDEWNECFPVSDYVSARYDNTRFHGHIPAYHLTMPRLFSKWDGKEYKRGLKLYATSWSKMHRRDWRPELLGVKREEITTVREFTPFEFANYCAYYHLMNITHRLPAEKLDYFYMLSQGNGWQARRMLTLLY